jgi:hypothetical protein
VTPALPLVTQARRRDVLRSWRCLTLLCESSLLACSYMARPHTELLGARIRGRTAKAFERAIAKLAEAATALPAFGAGEAIRYAAPSAPDVAAGALARNYTIDATALRVLPTLLPQRLAKVIGSSYPTDAE